MPSQPRRSIGSRLRGSRSGAILGVVLALFAGATTANAGWGAHAAVPVEATSTGDLRVSASWVSAPPTWTNPVPGSSSTTANLRVVGAGAGTTLRWALRASAVVPSVFSPHVTVDARAGTCPTGASSTGTGAVVPSIGTGYSPAGGLTPTATVNVCVRFTLASTAPVSLAGRAMNPVLQVFADQRGS